MSADGRVRRFFRVPRDRAIPPATIIRLELILVGLPVAILVMLEAQGLAAPLWLLAVTAACCYASGLAAAVLMVGHYQRRLDAGRQERPTPAWQATARRVAMLGGSVGALAGVWLSNRRSDHSAVVLVLAMLIVVFAGLVRGLMIQDQPKPRAHP